MRANRLPTLCNQRKWGKSIKQMQINFTRLNHVQLMMPPGAEATAREFYGGFLGLPEIPKPEVLRTQGGVWFQAADIELHLSAEAATVPTERHPAFEITNLAGTKAYLQTHNIRTRDHDSVPGFIRFSFYDPFGNRIELMERSL